MLKNKLLLLYNNVKYLSKEYISHIIPVFIDYKSGEDPVKFPILKST
jgi:hypothetical protein